MTLEEYDKMWAGVRHANDWRCMKCGAQPDNSGDWRWNGSWWEHHHGYPLGHVAAEQNPERFTRENDQVELPAPDQRS